jgi:hypothetical protein
VGNELVPKITAATDDAVGVLERVLEHYDAPASIEVPRAAQASELDATAKVDPGSSGIFDARFEALVAPELVPARPAHGRRVADASFMARWELHRKRGAVVRARERDDVCGLLSVCCSARRRVLKATSGVEQVLSQVEGRPSVFEGLYRTERQLAVDTRAAYFAFLSRLRREGFESGDVERGVRLAGTGIAKLVGRDVYQDLRVEDRLEIRMLQRRLVDWLLGPRNLQEGRRLLSDVSAFASLLMEVNRRPVLVEHDRELLQRVQAGLHQPSPDEAGLRRALGSLRGRDPDLDDLIELHAELRPEQWDTTVSRVLGRLQEQDQRSTAPEGHDELEET